MTKEDLELCIETVERWIRYWVILHGLTKEECIEIFRKELEKDR